MNLCEQLLTKTITKTKFVGYNYSFPFLSMDCGVYIEDNIVNPLYKCIFNIEYPSMVFIGVINLNFEIQVNTCVTLACNNQRLIEMVVLN